MRSVIIGFVLGIIVLQQQAHLIAWPWLIAAGTAAMLLVVASKGWKNTNIVVAALAGAACIAGFVWASLRALVALQSPLDAMLEERELTVVGTVASLPADVDFGQRFQFRIEQVLTPGVTLQQLPRKVLLTFGAGRQIGGDGDVMPAEAALPTTVQPGERWHFLIRLRRPHGLANPHGFDYEVWMLEQGLGASGSVRGQTGQQNWCVDRFVWRVDHVVQRMRGLLRERILHSLAGRPYAPIVVALVIGDQNGISQDDWLIFSRTGVNHLVAISGLHIGLVAGLAGILGGWLWRRSMFTRRQLPLRCPAQLVGALCTVLTALLYVALAGFGVPAQRALIMISICAAATLSRRNVAATDTLLLALGGVLLFDPWSILWPGFWLSFSAVALIFYASIGRVARSHVTPDRPGVLTSWTGRLLSSMRVQNAITLGLVPVTLLLFYRVSLIGPVANALAIPLVSLVVTPAALLGSGLPAPVGVWLLQGAHTLLLQLVGWLEWLADSDWAVWQAARPDWWMIAAALAGAAWHLAPVGWPSRRAGLLLWLPLVLQRADSPPVGQFRVTALDVGQGMALLVETGRHRLLYDTGPRYSQRVDAGSRVIWPYLAMRGITRLDALVISHNDVDHSGGAASLMAALQIGTVTSSLKPDSPVVQMAQQRFGHTTCLAGQHWQWDEVEFDMLHPAAAIYDSAKWKPNARSCTLRISNGHRTVLLAGDIEAAQELALVDAMPDKLRADVLLAPHHGSGTSSTRAFLQAVRPELALFQVGYHNRYHHPKLTVWQRYADFGIRRLRSDWSGAVSLQVGEQVSVEETRQAQQRYWSAQTVSDYIDDQSIVESP